MNILLVIDGHIRRAGVQILMLNFCKILKKNNYHFIWYFTGEYIDKNYFENLSEISNQIFWNNHKKLNKIFNYINIAKDINKIINQNQIDLVHVNSGLHFTNGLVLFYSKIKRIPRRISHIHGINAKLVNSNYTILNKLLIEILRFLILSNANILIACSNECGNFVYKRTKSQYIILPNGIEPSHFFFSPSLRKEIRTKLGLNDYFVIGTVSRFSPVKNHKFLIKCFWEISKKNNRSKLLMVGDGELKNEIYKLVQELKIDENVVFIDATNDVNQYLQAMDVFVLPSFTEGLGIVCIEAQATGLSCIVSTGVPKEVRITDNLEIYALSDGPQKWAEYILKYENGYLRSNNQSIIEMSKYNINHAVTLLDNIYQNKGNVL